MRRGVLGRVVPSALTPPAPATAASETADVPPMTTAWAPRCAANRALAPAATSVGECSVTSRRLAPPAVRVHSWHKCYIQRVNTVTHEVSTRELRGQLSDVLGRAMYAGERIGVTRNGKLAAVLVSVADLEALEEFEMAQDVAAHRAARAADDGERVSLDELRRDLSS